MFYRPLSLSLVLEVETCSSYVGFLRTRSVGSEYFLFFSPVYRNTAMTMRTINMASRNPAPTPVAIPTGKLSSVLLMNQLLKNQLLKKLGVLS